MATGDLEQIQAALQNNTGFDHPELWIDYAHRHGFKPTKAVLVAHCPDCSGAPRRGMWGQYVYYSTLIHLLECERCGLIWADAHIDPDVIRTHFELAYKSDSYFRQSRKATFEHLATLVDNLAPRAARVLDIGGARGDLMATVVGRRPDLRATVHDLSTEATDWAAMHYGFATLRGDANVLATHSDRYDVVILSDVLYYEPRLPVLWSALRRLTRPGGSVVIRLPNKAHLIRLAQVWFRLTHGRLRRNLQDRVPFQNPEHIFIFRRGYLRSRLNAIGFSRISFIPSPLTGAKWVAARSTVFELASIVNHISRQTLVVTPSMLVVGTSRGPDDDRVRDA